MNNFNEPNEFTQEEQNEFNKKFLIKFMIFMFFYRFYIMHIDQKDIVVNAIENRFNELTKEWSEEERFEESEEIMIDDLD